MLNILKGTLAYFSRSPLARFKIWLDLPVVLKFLIIMWTDAWQLGYTKMEEDEALHVAFINKIALQCMKLTWLFKDTLLVLLN